MIWSRFVSFSGQGGATHQITIALACGTAALVDRPDDEALAPAAIARREYARYIGRIFAVVGLVIRAFVPADIELLGNRFLRPEKAHGEQHKLGGQYAFGSSHWIRNELAFVVSFPLDVNDLDTFDVAVIVAQEALGSDQVNTRISAKFRRRFLLAVIQLVGLGPLGPRVVSRALEGRLGHDFELGNALAFVPERGAH